MAKKDITTENTTENSVAKFSIERLRKDCIALFGVSSATFDGATAGMTGEHTVEEMKNLIEDWLKKPIEGGM